MDQCSNRTQHSYSMVVSSLLRPIYTNILFLFLLVTDRDQPLILAPWQAQITCYNCKVDTPNVFRLVTDINPTGLMFVMFNHVWTASSTRSLRHLVIRLNQRYPAALLGFGANRTPAVDRFWYRVSLASYLCVTKPSK